jgi:hypothetical protein
LEGVFDKVYVFANASSKNLVRDIFQATYRIRYIRDKEMIYCIDPRHFGVNLSTYKKEIEQDLKMKYQYIVNQYEQHLQMNYPNKKTPEWIKQLVLSNIYEQNMSIMMLEQMFQRYLTECSYEHEDIDEEDLEEEMDMEEEKSIVDDLIEYKDIPELTFSQMKDLRKKKIFCSYVSNTSCPLTVSESKPEENTETVTKDLELELSDNEVKMIFNHLDSKRWENDESWRTLIWLGLKLGLSEGDIQEYSQDAQNYCEESTTKMINEYSPEKCNISMGTLFYYLQKDVDIKTYKELVNPYILDKLTQKKIDDLIHTEGYIEKKERWVLPEVLEGSKFTVIKAGLGKGKTTASIAHINSHKYDRIIVLTPRRTFAKSVCNRLNDECKGIEFVMYSNLKGKDYMFRNPFIVIQVESLNRLDLNQSDKTLLLCDEVESVLFQMTVSKTHKEKHIQNLDMLERLFGQSTKIICLDAFISNRTLTTLRLMNVPYTYYNYTLPLEDRTCIKIKEKDNFLTKLLLDLGQNKKIFLFSSSNNELVSNFLPTIMKKYPNKKVIEYHSKFTSLDLTNINDNWKDADMIACTVK